MWFVVWSNLVRRPGRAIGLLAGVAVAVASFVVLTGSTETSRLQVVGTVEANARSAYDVLVRPAGSRLDRESADGLVRPNFLSDHFGGITLDQVAAIRTVPGVEVAAPIAMVGYSLVTTEVPIPLGDSLPRDRRSVFRLSGERVVDGGLTRMQLPEVYFYFTPNEIELDFNRSPPIQEQVAGGGSVAVCAGGPAGRDPSAPRDPFAPLSNMFCQSLTKNIGETPGNPGQVWVSWPIPFLVAAIDPAAEAALVSLDGAVSSGGYLAQTWDDSKGDETTRNVPVLYSDRLPSDVSYDVTVEAMPAELAGLVPGAHVGSLVEGPLSTAGTVVWSGSLGPTDAHQSLAGRFSGEGQAPEYAYWTPGPVEYGQTPAGALVPKPVEVTRDVWQSEGFGMAPPEATDIQFRDIVRHGGSANTYQDEYRIRYDAVGSFDPTALRGFSALTAVPLTTYSAPGLSCADQHSCDLLRGGKLLPNGSPGGYLQQPPLLLTNLDSLPAFYNGYYRDDEAGQAAVSAVRVRVADVAGVDPLSRERVRLVAEQIAARTGLDVDVTVGSSPTPQAIELPAGEFGRPQLSLTEPWTKKGVASTIITAIDRKSLVLLILVLVVCALFVGNASASAVRTRRAELGVLAAIGWTRRGLFRAVLDELLLLGLAAGLLGAAMAWLAGSVLGLGVHWPRALLAVPAAIVLSIVAGLVPAWRASRVDPMASLRPSVSAGRRARLRLGIAGLAAANLRRRPGRALLGGSTLALAVAALTMLLAIIQQFQGAVVGSLLGEAIAVRIRGVDIAAVVAMLVLASVAVADVLYLNVRDRAAEFMILRATGWTGFGLARLVAVEGLLLGVASTAVGAACGLAAAVVFAGSVASVGGLLPTAGLAAALGTGLACTSLLAPVAALLRRSTVRLLAEE